MKKTNKNQNFWNKEYDQKRGKGPHLTLSDKPSEDMLKFLRFIEKLEGKKNLNTVSSVLDLGCGNGRNLIYIAKTYGMSGTGFDISEKAISEAKKAGTNLPIKYEIRSIADSLPFPDNSISLVLDMMTSHFLSNKERRNLQKEIFRILKPGGWFFLKTFLKTRDPHAERLLKESPGDEASSYIHPEIGVPEHVFTENEIKNELDEEFFVIHKITKSHNLLKRRSMSIYVQKPA